LTRAAPGSTRAAPGSTRALLARILLAGVVVVGVVIGSAGAASAHAVLQSSQPTDGERLPTAPTSVSLQFNEPVKADLGGLKVVDTNGKRVDTGTDQTTGDALTTALQRDLPDGTYVASYRVVSADGHPVKGAIVFAVGDASATDVDLSTLAPSSDSERGWNVLGDISRFLTYVGALTAAGLAFFLVFVHDGGPDARPLGQVVRLAALVGAAGTLGVTATQAALATGQGWSAVFDPAVLHQVMVESLAWSTIVVLVGLVLVVLSLETGHRGARQGLAFYGGMATTLSFVLTGHATNAPDRWVAVFSDAVHVTAAAVWIGGLVGLATVLIIRTRAAATPADTDAVVAAPVGPVTVGTTLMVAERPIARPSVDRLRGTAAIVTRFSTVALVSMVALAVAGIALAWVELGSLAALFDTTYGRLILAKLAVVAVIVVLAAYNRLRLVPQILTDIDLADDLAPADIDLTDIDLTDDRADTDPPTEADGPAITTQPDAWADDGLRHLARTVLAEALAVVVVLALTSVLVNTTPGRDASGEVSVVNQTLPVTTATPGSTLNLVVAPGQAGINALHLSYYDSHGRPVAVSGPVKIELTLPSADIGPIERDPQPAGPGHYILEDADLSPGGLWTITVVTRTSEFDQQRTAFSVKIR
jgi:copper transport protein